MGTIILILQKRNLRPNLHLLTCFYSLNIFPRKRIFIFRTFNFFQKFNLNLNDCGHSVASVVSLCDPMDCSPPGSSGFSQQKYWSRLQYPPPRDLSNSGIKPTSPEFAGRFFTAESWRLFDLKA